MNKQTAQNNMNSLEIEKIFDKWSTVNRGNYLPHLTVLVHDYNKVVKELQSLLTAREQQARREVEEEKKKWLEFYRTDIFNCFIPKCGCGRRAITQTIRGKYEQDNLHRPVNWGYFCKKCFDEGLKLENEAMYGN